MSDKSEINLSVNESRESGPDCGEIGFPSTREATGRQTNKGKVTADDNGEISAGSLSESDNCDSSSELTGKGATQDAVKYSNAEKCSHLKPGGKLRVAFVDMDGYDTNSHKTEINSDLSKLSRKGTGSVRYTQPRLSLLGKPINYRMHKRDIRYRRLQSRIYNFLERPKIWYAFVYHIGICVVCIGALVLSTLSTISRFEPTMSTTVMYLEPVLLIWLMTEYAVRIWASGCRSRYQGRSGRIRFAQRPLCIIDLVIILATMLVILLGSTSEIFAASTLRGLRFFQILRMVRMDRRAGTWKLLASVVWAHRRELLTTLYIGFLGLLFFSFMVYLAEKDHDPERFGTYADALWWGVVTLCTVGYGDVVPTTWAGKLIASFSAILGISFFALPAGILGSGFALKVQQQQRQKHLIRRRVPAALLIQSIWRCYAADENSMSIATWKPHMIPCPSPTQERPFKQNTSFVSRFSTRRKDRGGHHSSSGSGNISPHSPMVPRRENRKNGSCSEEDVPDTLQSFVNRTWSHLSLATGLVDQRVDKITMIKENSVQSFCSKHDQYDDEPDLSPKMRELTDTHKKAIRALRKIRYFVARKKFREALRPYDVKDVIEQYSAGHVDMLGRIKSLQCRIDQILGKAGSKNKDVYESKVSLSSRIVKVERQVEDIESKLDLLIDLYKEDRKVLLAASQPQLEQSPDGTQDPGNCAANDVQQQQHKPRSILIDKQYTSEPSTPITARHPKRFMQRNHSDLSSRIRKRVTYRLNSNPGTHAYNTNLPHGIEEKNSFIPENTFLRTMSEHRHWNQSVPVTVDEFDQYSHPHGTLHELPHNQVNSANDVYTTDFESSDSQLDNCENAEEYYSATEPQKAAAANAETELMDKSDSQQSLVDISICDPVMSESDSSNRLCNKIDNTSNATDIVHAQGYPSPTSPDAVFVESSDSVFTSPDVAVTSRNVAFPSSDSVFSSPDVAVTSMNMVFTSSDSVLTSSESAFTSQNAVYSSPVSVFSSPDSVFMAQSSRFKGVSQDNSDHVVLMPLGSQQALVSDVSDV